MLFSYSQERTKCKNLRAQKGLKFALSITWHEQPSTSRLTALLTISYSHPPGTFIALGSLSAWHARLISRGETSIEGNINKRERARYAAEGQIYSNPYDQGWRMNWAVFLGINGLSTTQALKRVLLPSSHRVQGNGLTWPLSYSLPQTSKGH